MLHQTAKLPRPSKLGRRAKWEMETEGRHRGLAHGRTVTAFLASSKLLKSPTEQKSPSLKISAV